MKMTTQYPIPLLGHYSEIGTIPGTWLSELISTKVFIWQQIKDSNVITVEWNHSNCSQYAIFKLRLIFLTCRVALNYHIICNYISTHLYSGNHQQTDLYEIWDSFWSSLNCFFVDNLSANNTSKTIKGVNHSQYIRRSGVLQKLKM